MKNKVVIFTENNARILVNPPEVDIFKDRPNAYVNPDLRFVKGVSPEHWKQISGELVALDDAARLQLSIGETMDWALEDDSYENLFYKKLHSILENEILSRRKASQLMTKLLGMLSGVDREDVTNKLKDAFIKKSTNPHDIKNNQHFSELINQWVHGVIFPMSEDERKDRNKNISKVGAANTITRSSILRRINWAVSKRAIGYCTAIIIGLVIWKILK